MKFFGLLVALVCTALPTWAVPVSVTVIGPNDKPLTDAKLSWSETRYETRYTHDESAPMNEPTGAGGTFAWEWDGEFYENWPVGEKPFLRVRVEAPGMAPQFQVIRGPKTTIRLQPQRTWSGLVLDQNQKPVADAQIRLGLVTPALEEGNPEGELLGVFIPIGGKTAVTDANGRWSLAGLPARGNAQLIVTAPNMVSRFLRLVIGEGEAAPVFLKPGGAVTGVVLAPDGTPVGGETVRPAFGWPSQAKTDPQGRFTLEGVQPGEVTLDIGNNFFTDKKNQTLPPYLFGRGQSVRVEAGKTADVGKIKAQKGLLIRARVIGGDTKKPLPDARLRIGYNSVANAMSDDGQLQTRILPPVSRSGFDRPRIENAGYVDYELSPALLETKDEVLDLGTIEMQRGNVIRGTVRIEGAPATVRPPGLSFSREGKSEFVRPKDDGSFASKTLAAGSYNVNLNGGQRDWQIVSPRTVTLPAAGQVTQPIEVMVRRLTPVLPLIKSARGRILDAQGEGVAGVTVRARMMFEGGGNISNLTATTVQDGTFVLGFGFRERNFAVEIESAEHPAYLIGGKAEVTVADGIATISGLTAKKRGATFAGRVVDAEGQPADKAWVAVVEARDYPPVQTGKDGTFALVDVPLDKFTLLAAQGYAWSKQAVQSEQSGLTLRLQGEQATVDRAQVLEQIIAIKDGVPSDKLFASWDVLGAEGVERFLRRNGEPNPKVMALFGAELARRDRAQLLRRAPELLNAAQGEARENLEAQINLVRAASDDAGERTKANTWLDEQKQIKRQINARSVTQLLEMAAVAQKLKRDDAAQWLDYAAALAAQLGEKNAESNAYLWSQSLAALGYDVIAFFAEGYEAPAEFGLWNYTTPILAHLGDLKGAQQALTRMEILLGNPAMVEAAEQARKQQRVSPASSLQTAQSAVASALASGDPVTAWKLAQKTSETFTRARAMLRVADGAARAGNADIAEKALREVMKARIGNVEYFAQAAAIGALVSPQLGEELFVIAKDKVLAADKRSGFPPPSVGSWAYYHAPYDPAQSRVLIEREWDWRLPAAVQTKNDAFSRNYNALYDLVKGMAIVDTGRAVQMQALVDAIETKNHGQSMSQFDIAVARFATAQERTRLGLGELF